MNHNINKVIVDAHLLNFKTRYLNREFQAGITFTANAISLDHVCPRFTVHKTATKKYVVSSVEFMQKNYLGQLNFLILVLI